jgi:hypothetical protein
MKTSQSSENEQTSRNTSNNSEESDEMKYKALIPGQESYREHHERPHEDS